MYRITTESICDVDVNYLQQRKCDVLFYSYTADGKEYLDDMWRQPQQQESLYAALQKGKPSTSLINQSRYEQFFLERLQTEDVLHIAFSSGLSSSANNAFLAAQKIEKMNLPHKLKVVDTLSGCGGMALLVEHALDMRDGGATMEEVWRWLEDNKLRPRHYFFTSDLSYLRRSGRVSGAVMLIGNLLRLCPVMRATDEGKLVAYAKTITAKKAEQKLIAEMLSQAEGGVDYDKTLYVAHAWCPQTAQTVADLAKLTFPRLKDIRISPIGSILSCHCGPGTTAIFFWGKDNCR